LVVVSEIAHIVADKPDGPRGASPLSPAERNRYENLILLCNVHHELIDSQPDTYTVERLQEIKAEHERWVEQRLDGRDVATAERRPRYVAAVHVESLRTVSAVIDPALLGIHPAIPLAVPVPGLDSRLPAYIERDIDVRLRRALREEFALGGFILLVGRAASGKSRTAYEAVRAEMPDWRIFMPNEAAEVNGLAEAELGDGRIVVWVDDLESILRDANLTVRAFRELISDPTKPVVIIGTLWPEQHEVRSAEPLTGQADQFRTPRKVLKLARRWDISTTFSQAELSNMANVAQADPRVREAERHSAADGSPTTVLACTPELISRFTTAGDSVGRALVEAAAQACAAGHSRVIPAGMLQRLAALRLSPELKATVGPDWFTEALTWARQPVRGVVPMIKPYAREVGTLEGYEVSDIITSHYLHDGFDPKDVSVTAWEVLATTDHLASCLVLGSNALAVGHLKIGRRALTRCVDAGMSPAAIALGFSCLDNDEPAAALRWFTLGHDAGERDAAALIAIVHDRQGDLDQARHWLKISAESGEPVALVGLGQLHEDAGEVDQAFDYYRQAADQGVIAALTSLGNLHADRDRPEEAVLWWKRAAAAGEVTAMMNLAQHDMDLGRSLGAELWWRAAAELGNVEACTMLADRMRERGQADEAAIWARRAAEAMHAPAWGLLGHLLAAKGEVEEGAAWLARGAEAGQASAMGWYAELLEDLGELDRAEHWMAKLASEHQLPAAQARYAIFLLTRGRTAAALPWIRRALDSGDAAAKMLLGIAAKHTAWSELIYGEVESRLDPPHPVPFPEQVRWTPIVQSCGCVIDWGWDQRSHPEMFMNWCIEMTRSKCVWHGADSGRFNPPPDGATIALSNKATGTSYFVRQAVGKDIALGQELTRQLRELLVLGNDQLLAAMPTRMRLFFDKDGYDPAEQWLETRLTDILLNQGGSIDWHGLDTE
jgi:TPR repeat protein